MGVCGYGWEGRALPPAAATESTAIAAPRPVALVPQPAAVAVPGTQPSVADAVPPQPTAVADTTTSVRGFDMDDFTAALSSNEEKVDDHHQHDRHHRHHYHHYQHNQHCHRH